MTRVVEAEILDQLPSADEAAVRSRRDLARLNALMGHARLIRKHLTPDISRIADLGAGDGTLLLNVLRRGCPVREVVLVDQQRIVTDSTLAAFKNIGVEPTIAVADVCEWLAKTPIVPHTALVTNLFLHHFNPPQLARLLELASAKCDLLIACEPRRGAWSQLAASLVGLIGCNRVTRHDAVVSVRAGFRDHELSALWPDRAKWQIEECSAGLFSHLFVARRR
jgi:hypothetical protein